MKISAKTKIILLIVVLILNQSAGCIGEPTVESLIQDLKDEDDNVRSHAIHSLGQIGDKKAIGPLIQAMNDENENIQVRNHAEYALSEIKNNMTVEHFTKIVKEADNT
ncbi:MAG: HEAT repeat domain-containing protein [Methanolobus sp.]|nr:HEAT repeat domain-containing protein [Methanolobus sp.]